MPETRFDEDERRQFRELGYIVVSRLFPKADLTSADLAIRELTARAQSSQDDARIMELEPELVNGHAVARRIYDPFHQHEAFRALATDARILDRVEQLIGPNIQLQHSKLNMKAAKVGSVVEWHQDLAYFPHTNEDLLATLVYLDNATVENGCLQVIASRHHKYLDHNSADGLFAGMITEALPDKAIPLPAPAGSVIFMHCLTPHTSLPNRSENPRRTLIFEYRAADAVPLYYGPMTQANESTTCHLRGERSRTARFGLVTPVLPRFPDMVTSLYDLQTRTKSRQATVD